MICNRQFTATWDSPSVRGEKRRQVVNTGRPYSVLSLGSDTSFSEKHFSDLLPASSYGLFCIISGTALLTVDLCDYQISGPVIIPFSPGQVITWQNANGLAGHEFLFSAEYLFLTDPLPRASFDNLFGAANPLIHAAPHVMKDLQDLCFKMEKELKWNTAPDVQILDGLMRLFFLYLSRDQPPAANPVQHRERDIWQKFIGAVKREYQSKKKVTDYARDLFVTPNYLNRVVKRITGSPASHHIQQCIVLEAKRRAMYTGSSMKEVAYQLGFSDYAHFSKFFKNNSGVNFSQFKTVSHSEGSAMAG